MPTRRFLLAASGSIIPIVQTRASGIQDASDYQAWAKQQLLANPVADISVTAWNKYQQGENDYRNGNVLALGSFSSISTLPGVPINADQILTSHFDSIRGKGRAYYRRWKDGADSSSLVPTWGQGWFWQQMLDGSKWLLDQDVPTSDMFGTVGDASRSAVTNIAMGADVTQNLNIFTRYLETFGKGGILSAGAHFVTDTILCGRGNRYSSVRVEGARALPWGAGASALPAARLLTNKNDRPAVAISGGRGSGWTNTGIEGPLKAFILANGLGLGAGSGPAFDDRFQPAWLPNATDRSPHSNGQYNPGCAIAIDPYAGTAPANGYPSAPYNSAWDENDTQYGKIPSSSTRVNGNYIEGFSVGIAIQPSNFDQNGDYTNAGDCTINDCITGVSGGNAQGRGLITRNLAYAQLHTVLAGTIHGRRIGNIAGDHSNWVGGHQICLVDFHAGYNPRLTINGPYVEGGYRLANVAGSSGSLEILGVRGTLDGTGVYGDAAHKFRGRPLNHIGVSATSPNLTSVPVRITGDLTASSLLMFNCVDIETDLFVNTLERRRGTTPYQACANNALAGGVAVPIVGGLTRQSVKVRAQFYCLDITTGAPGAGVTSFDGEIFQAPTRTTGTPCYAKGGRPAQHSSDVQYKGQYVTLGAPNSSSLSGRVATLVYNGYGIYREKFNLAPGDVWRHEQSGTWWFVSAFDPPSGAVVLTAQNGFLDSGGTISWPAGPPNLGAGAFITMTGRYYLPSYPLFGDFSSGSATIANVQTQQGAASNLTTDIAVGDYFYVDELAGGGYAQTLSTVASPTPGSPGSIGMSSSHPSLKTGASQRLIFKTAAPENNASPQRN